jgi:tetratricopeptide (TPR) repeat protein
MLASLLLLALTVAALGRVCGNDFVNYDDGDYVSENRQVQAGLTRESVAWAFTTTHAANWHPLTWLSLQLDHQLYGMAAWGYHLTNLLLHAANVLLLFLALRRLTGAVWRSALVAALFAVHPLHVESVAWVSERKDVLSGLFWMLTLLAYAGYAERPGWRRYLLVLLAFALGLMAKPMLVTLPCVLLLLDYWPLRRWRPAAEVPSHVPPASPLRLVLEKLPLFALVAASCAATLFAQRPTVAALVHLPFPFRLANAFTSYADYIGKMFWPTHLAALYPYPRAWFLWELLAAATVLVPVSLLALGTARQRPYIIVGWLWYLGTLVPVIGLVQVGKQQMADRYTYIPLVGLFLLLVWWAADLLAARPRRQALAIALAALVLLPCTALSWRQAGSWHDTESLWTHARDVTTDNADAFINVGSCLAARGQIGPALQHLRQALVLEPHDPMAHYQLGLALLEQGQAEEAAEHLRAARTMDPRQGHASRALGDALAKVGRLDEARQAYEDALRRDPRDLAAHVNLGALYARQGETVEAARHFSQALEIDPDQADAHNNLGGILVKRGELAAAVKHFAAALRAAPGNASAHCNLGTALLRLGRTDEAAQEYRIALRLQPDLARARQGLEAVEQRPNREGPAPPVQP